jgi:hypothetical protein
MRNPAFILFGGYTRSLYHHFIPSLIKMGMRVLVIDLPGSESLRNDAGWEPGMVDAVFCGGDDLPAILAACKRWEERYVLEGALNTIEEFTYSSAIAIDYLKLKGPGIKACTIASNKALQRAYFEHWSPAYRYLTRREGLPPGCRYPAMLKATGRHGGSGVIRVNSEEEALAALSTFDADERLNLEEYVAGSDISIETIVSNGEIVFQSLTEEDNLYSNGYHMEMGYNIPAVGLEPAVIEKAYDINRRVHECMGFQYGTSHAEYRVTPSGEIRLIEIAARPPGDGIFALYQLSTGKLIEESVLAAVMGREASYPLPQRYAKQTWLRHEPGILRGIDHPHDGVKTNYFPESKQHRREYPFDPAQPPTLREIVLERRKGERLEKMAGQGSRLGWVIIDAPTAQLLARGAEQFLGTIRISMAIALCCYLGCRRCTLDDRTFP